MINNLYRLLSSVAGVSAAVTTVIPPVVIPPPITGVPRGDTSRMSTAGKTARDLIANTVATNAWAGYSGQTITNTITVTSGAAIQTAINNFSTNSPNVWNEILVDDGDYSAGVDLRGNFGTTIPQFNLTTGGCIIRRKSGANPQFTAYGDAMIWAGVGVDTQDLTFCGYHPTNRNFNSLRIPQTNPLSVLSFQNNRIGILYNAGVTTASYNLYPFPAVKIESGESMSFVGNEFYGVFEAVNMTGVHYARVTNNDFRLIAGFGMHFNTEVTEGAPITFSNGGVWLHFDGNVDRGNWYDNATDYTETSLPHRDIIQNVWAGGTTPVNRINQLIENTVYIAPVQSSINQDPPNSGKLSPETNLLQTSDFSNVAAGTMVLFNNLGASIGFLTQEGGARTLYVECNSVVGANVYRTGAPDGVSNAWATILAVASSDGTGGQNFYSNKNVAQFIGNGNANANIHSTNDVIAQMFGTATVGHRYGDLFQGAFTLRADSNYWVWDLGGTANSFTRDALRTKIINQYIPKAGVTAGATFS